MRTGGSSHQRMCIARLPSLNFPSIYLEVVVDVRTGSGCIQGEGRAGGVACASWARSPECCGANLQVRGPRREGRRGSLTSGCENAGCTAALVQFPSRPVVCVGEEPFPLVRAYGDERASNSPGMCLWACASTRRRSEHREKERYDEDRSDKRLGKSHIWRIGSLPERGLRSGLVHGIHLWRPGRWLGINANCDSRRTYSVRLCGRNAGCRTSTARASSRRGKK